MSPEFRLAVACAMWPPSERKAHAVAVALGSSLDAKGFLRLVERHRITGLAHHALRHAPHVPPDVIAGLAEAQRRSARRGLALAAEAVQLQRLLNANGIGAAFLKGASLAMVAYRTLGLRASGDIDLLVSPADVPRALALLRERGYRDTEPSSDSPAMLSVQRHVGVMRPDTRVVVEVHWRLSVNARDMAKPPDRSTWQVVEVAPGSELATFGDTDLLAYLCLHGAGHVWARLQWLADVAALLDGASPARIEALLRLARDAGGGRAAAQAILLCELVLRTRIPPEVSSRLRRDWRTRVLVALALRLMQADPRTETQRRLAVARLLLARLLLAEGWRSVLSELRFQWVVPMDVRAVPLPRPLHFLYPLLRLPLWLMRRLRSRGECRQIS